MDQENKNKDANVDVQVFMLKKLFKKLQNAKVCGSVVTLIIPPRKQIAEISRDLVSEIGRAASIKDKNNMNTVIEAQTSARERLKNMQRAPNNGLILFSGRVIWEGSKSEKKVIYCFQPYKPVNLSLYSCSGRFQIDELKKILLVNEPQYGFIVVDGEGALYAISQGNSLTKLMQFSVDLPNKHNKGGQSAPRFSRLRTEKRHNYIRSVCQGAVDCFITNNKCNVEGIIIAGSADFKNQLFKSEMFDPRLEVKVIHVVSVSYGFGNGLNEALTKSCEVLKNVKLIKEKKSISDFFDHLRKVDGLSVSGVEDTMKYLQSGAIKKILCYENLDYLRLRMKNPETGELLTVYRKPEQANQPYFDKVTRIQLEQVNEDNEQLDLLQWLVSNYKNYGCQLEFVSSNTPEGTQFVKGLGGIAGFLRYKVELEHDTEYFEDEEDDDDFN